MNPLFEAAVEFQRFCEDRGWAFCFIGGLAVQRWGEPRVTKDVDLTLITELGAEQVFIDGLLTCFDSRIPDAESFAMRNRVVLLRASNSIAIDVSLGWLDFEKASVERSSLWSLDQGFEIRTCSAEDLIVHKVFAGRLQDWLDVQGIIQVQAEVLIVDTIFDALIPLLDLKEDRSAESRLRAMLTEGNDSIGSPTAAR